MMGGTLFLGPKANLMFLLCDSKIKHATNGNVEKYKARFVARVFSRGKHGL